MSLPGEPVEVTAVRVGGVARDPASYRLDGSYLVDLSGRGWPTCDPGMVVDYLSGRTPPADGVAAAALLARELARAATGDPSCLLPTNTTSVTRQGITQSIQPASVFHAAGRTGIPAVDLWLATVNPGGLRRRARAWSPDTEPRTYLRPVEETSP